MVGFLGGCISLFGRFCVGSLVVVLVGWLLNCLLDCLFSTVVAVLPGWLVAWLAGPLALCDRTMRKCTSASAVGWLVLFRGTHLHNGWGHFDVVGGLLAWLVDSLCVCL